MYEAMDKKYVVNTYPRNYINFVYGKNATLYDKNERDYIDFTSGIGVVSVGHGNKQVAKALYEQAKKITHISNLYLISPQALLAKRISELSGQDVATFFANSGAEANEGAIKLARKYGTRGEKKRYKIITLEHSFHGRTLATIKATGQSSFHQEAFAPYPEGFLFAKDIKSVMELVDDETVAVMIELIQGEGGVCAFKKQEVQELSRFLRKKDVLLIVDEVQSGVFRSGEFLASNAYGITADITTLAKGLGGGVPIGAVVTTHKDIFEVGDHGTTFGGTFLVSKTALEVLGILEKLYKEKKLEQTIKTFDKFLDELLEKYPHIFLQKTGLGLMRGLRCKEDIDLALLIKKAFKEGVLVLKAGQNTLRFLPPLTIKDKEIKKGFKRLKKVLKGF